MTQETLFFWSTQLPPTAGKERINSVCLSPDGKVLVSGGEDGFVKVWDVPSKHLKQSIPLGSTVLVMHWTNLDDHVLTFLVGASDGSVTLFYIKSGQFVLAFKGYVSSKVEYMHMDVFDHTFAVIGGDILCIWTIQVSRSDGETKYSPSEITIPEGLVAVVSKPPNFMRPRTVHFLSQATILVSFAQTDIAGASSHIAIFRMQPWKLIRAVDINHRIGLSALSEDRKSYAFTNLLDGIDLYSSTSLIHRNSIPHHVDPCNNLALGLVMVADTYIVVGSSGGTIWMYDQGTGGVVARLQSLTSTATIQAVTAYSGRRRSLVVGGSTDGNICVWEWETVKPQAEARKAFLSSQLGLSLFTIVLMLFLYFPLSTYLLRVPSSRPVAQST